MILTLEDYFSKMGMLTGNRHPTRLEYISFLNIFGELPVSTNNFMDFFVDLFFKPEFLILSWSEFS